MSDFMAGYGVAEARRGRIIKRTILGTLAVAIVTASAYFYFRTWSQERIVNQFLAKIEQKDYQSAYGMWCSAQSPCPYYPLDKFLADFGPDAPYNNVAAATVEEVDYCDNGVVVGIAYPKAEPVGLWVERSTGVISFAPWPRCPGKRLTLGPLMERLFGKG
jgi:hypothetical protein